MKSIAGRITAIVLIAATVLLVVVAILLDVAIKRQIQAEFDRQLLVRVEGLTLLTDYDETGEVEFDYEAESMPSFRPEHEQPEYFVLRTESGETLAVSDSATPEIAQTLGTPAPEDGIALLTTQLLSGGRTVRLATVTFSPVLDIDLDELDEDGEKDNDNETAERPESQDVADAPRLQLTVARGTEEFNSLLSRIRAILFSGIISLLLALIALVWFGVSRGLKPIRALASEVATLNEDRLDVRVSEPVGASELVPVSNQLNDVLRQLEEAFHRERSFSGNVAHELRTPIAELRSFAEIGSKWPQDKELAERYFGELVNLSGDMERTVLNLLMLSRLDSGSIETEVNEVNVAELVNRVWSKLSPQASEHNAELEIRVPEGLFVATDPDKLHLILTNLISNAIAHSTTGSPVVVETDVRDEQVSLAVCNKTDQLNDRDLSVMFDRFWRKDKARTSGRHAGLGLSIVKSLADVLDLRVEPALTVNSTFKVTLDGFRTSDKASFA